MDSIRVAKVENVTLVRQTNRSEGTLHLTPHHLIFIPHAALPSGPSPVTSPSTSSSNAVPAHNEIWIPYPLISHLTRLPLTIQNLSPLQLRTKTFESYVFLFSGRNGDRNAEDVWLSVRGLGVASSIDRLYAFSYRPSSDAIPSSSKVKTSSTSAQPSTAPTPSNISNPLLELPHDENSPLESTAPFLPIQPTTSNSATSTSQGWNIYSPREEFARMGVGTRTKAWRFTDLNKDYVFSPTYPAKLVVPSKISDAVLVYAGKYRSKARIPALSYLHWANQATITRCSQPLVGFKNARSPQDERLIDSIFTSHLTPEANLGGLTLDQANHTPSSSGSSSPRPAAPGVSMSSTAGISYGQGSTAVYGATATNLIVDARPTTNAMANVAMGAGTENMENYKGARKAYLGIDNIHVMRDSLHKVVEALREAEYLPSGMIDKHMLRRSNWLKHISAIIEGSVMIVRNIHINSSHVLIHCSDGWDRTTQLAALAQVCLDPFYRTIRGIEILIEKDWMSFGHKFLDRSGHLGSDKTYQVMEPPDDDSENGVGATEKAAQAFFKSVSNKFASSGHSKEVSPVFHQFLDCVWQLQKQFPERFEFNGIFLETLFYHLYSCQFGNFIANNERQRRTAPSEMEKDQEGFSSQGVVCEQTSPIWDWLNDSARLATYRNELYNPALDKLDAKGAETDMGVLLPDPKEVRFWHDLFKRADEDMNGKRIIQEQLADAETIEAIRPIDVGERDPVADAGPAEVAKSVAVVAERSVRLDDESEKGNITRGWSSVGAQSTPPRSSSVDNRMRTGLSGSQPQSPARIPSRQSGSSGTRGGWGWSQISSGALSAISAAGRELNSAAKEIKSISSEAFTNFAAGEEERDGGEMRETGQSLTEGLSTRTAIRAAATDAVDPWGNPIPTGAGPPSTAQAPLSSHVTHVRRAPTEANPWATTSMQQSRSAPGIPSFEPEPEFLKTAASTRSGPRSASGVDYLAAPSATWGSVADRKAAAPAPISAEQFTRPAATKVEEVSRGMAGMTVNNPNEQPKKDNWDPLGAL